MPERDAPLRQRFVDVSFRPVREIDPGRLAFFLGHFGRLYTPETRSFGARVIRGGGETVLKQCLDWLQQRNARDPVPQPFNGSTGLHRDGGHPNETTVLYTRSGRADMLVLVGLSQKYQQSTAVFPEGVTARLYDNSQLDTMILVPPHDALRTTANAGDIVLLDHSQLHASRRLSDDRQATAYY